MNHIFWTDDFSVGIPEIDEQHKKILTIFNRLVDAREINNNSEALHDVFAELMDYAEKHLDFEEQLLSEYEYPDFEQHEQEHHRYLERYADLVMSVTNSDNDNIPEETMTFLKDWWEKHILLEDMKYKDFFKEKNI